MTEPASPTVVGRYRLHAPIARGGMATIHLARLLGAEGFSRTVAAKRLHPQFTEDAEFLKMFLDEARIASKVHHPNVVPVLDVVQAGAEVILVQEYVHGVPFDKLLRAAHQQNRRLPVDVTVAILAGMLAGLAAAHEAKDELGEPLGIVHRDVSPQNVMVGVDGIARLLDFGIAKATLNTHVTRVGVFKGKLGYTSPEMLRGVVTRAVDIYATGVLLWEALVGRRMYLGLSEPELIGAVSAGKVRRPTLSVVKASVSPERWHLLERLEPVVLKALAFAVEDRYATAVEMQEALLAAAPAATPAEVSKWVKALGKEYLEGREQLIVSEESSWRRQQATAAGADRETAPESVEPGETLRASVISRPPPRRRAEWPMRAAVLLIGALLAGILALLWRRPAEPAVVAAPSAAPPAVAAPAAEPAPPPAPPPAATASADGGAAPSAKPAPIVIPRATPIFPRAAAPASDCNPPFYFEGKKKIFKPGCL